MPDNNRHIREFFDKDDVPKFASDEILLEAIGAAVQNGLLMARCQNKAYLKEKIPDAEITDDLELLAPLEPISGSEISHKGSAGRMGERNLIRQENNTCAISTQRFADSVVIDC